MKPEAHGGDRLRMAALAGRAPDSLLDFSVNVRPEGAPEFLRLALCRALDHISAYPSPHAEEAMEAAARVYGLPADWPGWRYAIRTAACAATGTATRTCSGSCSPC